MNDLNFFSRVKIFFQKPKVVIIFGEGRRTTKEAILEVLKRYFKVGEKVLVYETDLKNNGRFKFLIKKSSLPILVITHLGEIPPERDFFAGDKEATNQIQELIKNLPPQGYLLTNFDDETTRELKEVSPAPSLTFGFQERADFRATDINLNSGVNFKINYKGNIIPIWLEKLYGKEYIYSALAAASVGTVFDLNLIEISQALKKYQGLPGKMKLISGIKNSWILDDSESASVSSMIEAIEIFGKLAGFGRKLAVLGDVLGVGKYTIEAHEAIGERIARSVDLLFTFGLRAKFIAQGAQNKGLPLEKIFQYDTIEQGKLELQDKIEENDLILVDGSKEMEMRKVVKEIKAV